MANKENTGMVNYNEKNVAIMDFQLPSKNSRMHAPFTQQWTCTQNHFGKLSRSHTHTLTRTHTRQITPTNTHH